eukprot:jgi/Phyca11/21727/fgenesh1_pg.PHYCAscaffold_111_\
MSTLPDSKVEGITGFSSNPEKSYRYEISLKRGQVNIWVEDRSSKKQWQTGFLAKENYVTSANVFVDAAASDYVSLKDQEEKLERLSEKIGSGTTAFLYIESERVINAKLQWKETIAETFALNEDKTSIKILVPASTVIDSVSTADFSTLSPGSGFTTGNVEAHNNFGALDKEGSTGGPCRAELDAVSSDEINIWLEDRFSKKQWQSGFLSKDNVLQAMLGLLA